MAGLTWVDDIAVQQSPTSDVVHGWSDASGEDLTDVDGQNMEDNPLSSDVDAFPSNFGEAYHGHENMGDEIF